MASLRVFGLILLLAAVGASAQQRTNNSQTIWTSGPLLEAVELLAVFNDSKTFVDLPLLRDAATVDASFNALPKEANGFPANSTLQDFLAANFGTAGSDFESAAPDDFSSQPEDFLPNVTDPSIRQWALQVNDLWQDLCREVNQSVMEQPQLHSLLPLPGITAVPGDRFKELYYWDSFWVIKGLLVSGMTETAMSEVRNLLSLLETYGHVPNGARVYYINRSQPPMLSNMVLAVNEAAQDDDFLAYAMPLLVSEHDYWTSEPKQVTVATAGGSYNLSRFYADWFAPRPESYLEDYQSAQGMSPSQQKQLWHDLASGAESGMDFTSRWFSNPDNITTIQTTRIIPAELNAYLYQMETNIADLADQMGNSTLAASFRGFAAARKEAINTLMYSEAAGKWFDLLIEDITQSPVSASQHNNTISYVSQYIPLWVGIADEGSAQAQAVTQSFFDSGLIQPGGISTSTYNSTQQWDFPNCWAPLQDIMVEALTSYGGEQGQREAEKIVQIWLNSNYLGFQETGFMVEKYDAVTPGIPGAGGEYTVQSGFGWTNGVMLSFLNTFGWNPEAANMTTAVAE
uniref:Trehalase n=1 Tax=Trebouxia lynnae TaxID=1825957 RepID=A0A7L9QEF9_9CHLO|nr:putative extracellular protein TR9_008 [Trebouxia lynnae]